MNYDDTNNANKNNSNTNPAVFSFSTPPDLVVNHVGENFAHSCMRGRRPTMEDAFSRYKFGNYCCYAVFDGHGGPKVSAVLGEHLFLKFEENILNNFPKTDEKDTETNRFLPD